MRLISSLLVLMMLLSLLPIAAMAAVTDYGVNINIATEKYLEKDSIKVSFQISTANSATVTGVSSALLIYDTSLFDLIDTDGAAVATTSETGVFIEDRVVTAKASGWTSLARAITGATPNTAYLSMQPYTTHTYSYPTATTIESVRLGLKAGKSTSDITTSSIRFALASELEPTGDSAALIITDTAEEEQYYNHETPSKNTLSAPTFTYTGFVPAYGGTQASTPSLSTKKGGAVTLKANATIPGETVEYGVAAGTDNYAAASWQDSPSFTVLTVGTHFFYARVKEVPNVHTAGLAATAAVTVFAAPTISYSGNLDGLTVGTAITGLTPTATVGSGGESYAVSAGTLPAGLALNASTGAITGTPTTANGTGATVTVKITDSEGQFKTADVTYSAVAKMTVTREKLDYSLTPVSYNGTAKSVAVTAKNGINLGTIKVYYAGSETAPTVAGTYAVTVDATGSVNCEAITGLSLGDFVINKATPAEANLNIDISAKSYTGSAQSVTITPKTGVGAVTIYYEGTNGTNYTKNTTAPTNVGTYAITVDIANSTNYSEAIGVPLGTFTINKATPTASNLSYTPTAVDYNGSARTASVDKVTSGIGNVTVCYTGTGDTDYTKRTAAPTNAGTYAITANVAVSDNYNSASDLALGSFTINKIDPKLSDLSCSNMTGITFDGTQKPLTVTDKSSVGLGTITVLYNGSPSYPVDAGTYAVTVSIAASTNYNATSTPLSLGNYTINKATAPHAFDETFNYVQKTAKSDTYNLDNITFNSVVMGTRSYVIGTLSGTTGIFSSTPTLDGNLLSYAISGDAVTGQSATQTVIFKFQNYNDITVTLTFNIVNKTNVSSSITFADGSAAYNRDIRLYEHASMTDSTSYTAPIAYTYAVDSSVTPNTASLSNGKPLTAGAYTVTAKYEDVSNIGEKTVKFVVTPVEVALSWSGDATRGYDGNASAVTAAAGGIISGDVCTVTVTGGTETNVGDYTATATALGNTNYKLPGAVTRSYTISKGTYDMSGITLANSNITYSQSTTPVAVTGTLPTGVTAAYTYVGINGTTYKSSTIAPTNAGTYTVTAKFTGTANYNTIPDKTCTLTIAQKEVTLNWSGSATRVYDGSASAVTATAGSLEGDDTCNVTVNGGTAANAGTYTATAASLSNTNYKLPTAATQAYTISKATYVMSGVSLADSNATYNKTAKSVAVTGTLPTGVTVAYTYVGTNYAASSTAPTDAGTYTVTAKFTGSANYNAITDMTRTLTIAQKEVTLSWSGSATRTYDGSASAVTATVGSLISGDTCTVTVTGGTDANAGSHTATAASLSNANYKLPATATQSYTINKANQAALTLNLGTALLVGNSLTATTSGGSGDGTVTYEITSGGSYATLTSATLAGTAAGTVTVRATKAASTNYNEISAAPVTVTVSDKMAVTAAGINKADIKDAAIAALLKNEGKYTVGTAIRKSANVNEFTVAVTGTAALDSYASSVTAQGSGKWVGIILGGVQKNAASALGTAALWYKSDSAKPYSQLTADDLTEVQSVGGSNGQFILWLKSEDIKDGKTFYIATDSSGTNAIAVTVNFTEYSIPYYGGSTVTGSANSNTTTNTGSDGSVTKTTKETVKNNDGSVTSTTTAATTDKNGNAIGSSKVSSTTTTNSNKQVVTAVSSVITTGTPDKITIDAGTETGKTTAAEVQLPSGVISSIAEKTESELVIATDVAKIAFDKETVDTIAGQATGYDKVGISAGLADTAALTEKQKAEAGNYPVFDLKVVASNSTGETKKITNFDGTATVTIPASKLTGQDAKNICIYYLSDDGTMTKMTGQANPDGSYSFTTKHFSYYVAVSESTASFTDVSRGNWYYEAVNYAVGNNLFTGTSATAFDPDKTMTRAMLVTVMYRLEGKPVVSGANTFADVEAGQWYTDAVRWATSNNIVTGYDAKTFGTNDSISREQLATILYRYAKYKGHDVSKSANLSAFADSSSVSGWALASMNWTAANGFISGTTATTLSPKDAATRAQVAAIIMRFAKNTAK